MNIAKYLNAANSILANKELKFKPGVSVLVGSNELMEVSYETSMLADPLATSVDVVIRFKLKGDSTKILQGCRVFQILPNRVGWSPTFRVIDDEEKVTFLSMDTQTVFLMKVVLPHVTYEARRHPGRSALELTIDQLNLMFKEMVVRIPGSNMSELSPGLKISTMSITVLGREEHPLHVWIYAIMPGVDVTSLVGQKIVARDVLTGKRVVRELVSAEGEKGRFDTEFDLPKGEYKLRIRTKRRKR